MDFSKIGARENAPRYSNMEWCCKISWSDFVSQGNCEALTAQIRWAPRWASQGQSRIKHLPDFIPQDWFQDWFHHFEILPFYFLLFASCVFGALPLIAAILSFLCQLFWFHISAILSLCISGPIYKLIQHAGMCAPGRRPDVEATPSLLLAYCQMFGQSVWKSNWNCRLKG